MPGDVAAGVAFLQKLADDMLRLDFDARLKEKHALEEAARLEQAVAKALQAQEPAKFNDEFVGTLTAAGISSRSDPGYADLLHQLVTCDVPLRGRKLMTLLTGRDAAGEPVWSAGNVEQGDVAKYEAVFAAVDPTGNRWRRFLAMREKYKITQYRPKAKTLEAAAKPNRHGFSAEHRSWSNLGYKSLSDFEKQDPAGFAAWVMKDTEVRKGKSYTARLARKALAKARGY
jgi:hypothetical protein